MNDEEKHLNYSKEHSKESKIDNKFQLELRKFKLKVAKPANVNITADSNV